jgi:hypothetical protein
MAWRGPNTEFIYTSVLTEGNGWTPSNHFTSEYKAGTSPTWATSNGRYWLAWTATLGSNREIMGKMCYTEVNINNSGCIMTAKTYGEYGALTCNSPSLVAFRGYIYMFWVDDHKRIYYAVGTIPNQ